MTEPRTQAGKRLLDAFAPPSDAEDDPRHAMLLRDILAIEAETEALALEAGLQAILAGTGWRLFELDDATGWRCLDDEAGWLVDAPTRIEVVAAAIRRATQS